MGKLQEFEIAFDKNKVVYTPGESISGTVSFKLSQPLQCKAIKVNCNGFCGVTTKVNDTAWTEEEQYFNSSVSVADKGTLKQGDHTFPFKFLIPATAPTSYEGSYGKIIYRVRAFIDTPRFAKDYNAEKAFFLLRLLNLNEVPDIWGPSSSAITQNFTYMLMKTGTIVLQAQTDMKGYTPNQVIHITANIHNQSTKTTGHIAASLVQRVTYETKKPTHDVKKVVELEGGTVKGGREVEWKEKIIIPPLPQSSLAGCELIKIEYYVEVGLKSPEVTLTLPIHIGNVSLDKKMQKNKKAASFKEEAAVSPLEESPSSPMATPPEPAPKPAPRPAPRARLSSQASPSAPPAEFPSGADGGNLMSEDMQSKRHSQRVLPHAFSYAPGVIFPQIQSNGSAAAPTRPPHGGSSRAPGLYPSVPLNVQPPDYGASAYPEEAPPSYESCNT